MRHPGTTTATELRGQQAAPAPLRGAGLAAARVAWVALAALAAGYLALGATAQHAALRELCSSPPCAMSLLSPEAHQALEAAGLSASFYAAYSVGVQLAFAAVAALVGAVIFARRSDDAMAVLTSATLVSFAGFTFAEVMPATAERLGPAGLLLTLLAYLGNTAAVLLFFIFPDGRLTPRWAVAPALLLAALNLARFFAPGTPPDPQTWPRPIALLAYAGLYSSALAAQAARYRRATMPVQRQQTRLVIFGVAIAVAGSVGTSALAFAGLPLLPTLLITGPLSYLATLVVPLSIGAAILRYRLWDIDLLINRALLYGALTACVAALYALVVGGLGAALQAAGSPWLGLAGAVAAALALQPLRERLQRAVNRALYGDRDEPYAALARLGRRLEQAAAPQAMLETAVQTVREALRLPYVAVLLEGEEGAGAEAGEPVPEPLSLPLSFGGERVGSFVLGPRAPGEPFSAADRRLLDDLARQIGVAAHAARLALERQRLIADLQGSRERLVRSQEEERRRIRRDLHDGLGPTLAALALAASALPEQIGARPEAAAATARGLEQDLRATIGDIRRLVYGLRPPALDELGLVGALRDRASRCTPAGAAPAVSVEAPESLGPLPAAVEVAAFRIAEEALTNAVRHAQARSCVVRLSRGSALLVEVLDDGVGIDPQAAPGVGLRSMRERAEELGGRLEVGPRAGGGTRVAAALPTG